jgi:hypothetical protein
MPGIIGNFIVDYDRRARSTSEHLISPDVAAGLIGAGRRIRCQHKSPRVKLCFSSKEEFLPTFGGYK